MSFTRWTFIYKTQKNLLNIAFDRGKKNCVCSPFGVTEVFGLRFKVELLDHQQHDHC